MTAPVFLQTILTSTKRVWYSLARSKVDIPVLEGIEGLSENKFYAWGLALSDFIKVIELEPGNLKAFYALASTASLAYKNEYALYWLEKALEAGYNNYELLADDPSLDNIRNTTKFQFLMEKYGNKLTSTM